MCTVSFLPKGGNDFILTSNRDEKVSRDLAHHPEEFLHQHLKILFPQDPKAKGTWIATAENGFSLCLLNGGFVAHKSNPPYRKSRGTIILDFFQYNNVNQFVINHNFQNIEPFTLIIIEYKSTLKLNEIRWDGKQAHWTVLNINKPHFWSSVTLYSPEVRAQRETWFKEWRRSQKAGYLAEDVINFHLKGGKGDIENDLVMRRNSTNTVSITQIIKKAEEVEMIYLDCIKNLTSKKSIQFK